jgi:hypothetical protein
MISSIKKENEPQLPYLKMKEDDIAHVFYMEQNKKLKRIKKIDRKGFFLISQNKKSEILEETLKMCIEIIANSLLMYKYHDGGLVERKNIIKRPTAFLENYYQLFTNGIKDFQTLRPVGAEEDNSYNEISKIFDAHSGEYETVEKYEKMLEECKPYRGFTVHTRENWVISIFDNENNKIFSHEVSMLSLHRKPEKENEYYPYEYMLVCIDFELESGGFTEDEANKNLKESFKLLFRCNFKTSDDTESTLQKIKRKVAEKTVWKETFNELIRLSGDREQKNDSYDWKLDHGDSNGAV